MPNTICPHCGYEENGTEGVACPNCEEDTMVLKPEEESTMKYLLVAVIDGSREAQGLYTSLAHVLSRIKQLDEQYAFLEINRPTEYAIILTKE